jgi:hypothetical protein
MVVGQELDVANVKNHVQSQLKTCVFEDLGGAGLLGGESGDQAGVREAGEGFDVVGVPSTERC